MTYSSIWCANKGIQVTSYAVIGEYKRCPGRNRFVFQILDLNSITISVDVQVLSW